jgi:hypothetical protein
MQRLAAADAANVVSVSRAASAPAAGVGHSLPTAEPASLIRAGSERSRRVPRKARFLALQWTSLESVGRFIASLPAAVAFQRRTSRTVDGGS